MNYNLKEFLFSFKFNIQNFEELAFANSSFTVSKKELNNILFAANDKSNQEYSQNEEAKSNIPDYNIVVEEKDTLFNRLKKKITDIFKPKPKVYRIGNGESVELNGTVPGNPISGFFSRVGAALENLTNKPKEIKDAVEVKNEPHVISDYPAVQDEKKKQDPSLLNEGAPSLENTNIIKPKEITGEKRQPATYIQSTPPKPTVEAEEITVDAEEELKDNKDSIAKMVDSLDTDKQNSVVTPKAPEPVIESDDLEK